MWSERARAQAKPTELRGVLEQSRRRLSGSGRARAARRPADSSTGPSRPLRASERPSGTELNDELQLQQTPNKPRCLVFFPFERHNKGCGGSDGLVDVW